MHYILRRDEIGPRVPIGGKARALALLARAELPIPNWFVVTPTAFYASLPPGYAQELEAATDEIAIGKLVERISLSPVLQAQLSHALAELCPEGELVAVRSSALEEDGAQYSFAGQLESFLCVSPGHVPARVAAVWRSGFSERALAYRSQHGLGLVPRAPAVLVQRMVRAEVSGVAFSADPVSGRRGWAVVSALYGLGTALVSGEGDGDTYHVDREGRIASRVLATKQIAHRPGPGTERGTLSEVVPAEQAGKPALTDDQVVAVAELARRTEKGLGRPQDIEWALEKGYLYLLQSRPITSLARVPDPDGTLCLWDNSNIAESYSGITTPLTFSFARRIYEEVYRQFCRILGVPGPAIADNDEVFRHMLGLVHGRIYYNLFNWYRLMALLPGFTFNRSFMEQMMGVKEPLPDAIAAELNRATWRERLTDRFRFAGSLFALLRHHFGIDRLIHHFKDRLDRALGETCPDLSRMRVDELTGYYRDLERQLLTHWDAPLVNDFLAMIFYGVLRRLTDRWCGGGVENLHNNLLCAEGGMVSAEPAALVRALAETARADPESIEALCEGSLATLHETLARPSPLAAQFQAYLRQFGDRCLEELKLESATLHEDPLPLLRSVGQLARQLAAGKDPAGMRKERELRSQAEQQVSQALGWRFPRRLIFRWVLRHARARIRDRENLRLERTRLFGRVRRILVELGQRFYALDLLDQPRDIFYLEVNEILGYVDGTATCTDLRGLVALRKQEFEGYRHKEPPADRFETRGAVHQGNSFQRNGKAEGPAGDRRRGLGCCPGVVRGPVRIITDPRSTSLGPGEILVAERTDPGWIMLFASAAGLLVERGSLLSHSAIVARELGIPAIVSLRGVTRWLKDGDWVELDGGQGMVVRIPPPGDTLSMGTDHVPTRGKAIYAQ